MFIPGGFHVIQKFLFVFLTGTVILCPQPLWAAHPKSPTLIETQLSYYYYDYRETLPMPYKSNELGWMPGASLRLGNMDVAGSGFADFLADYAQSPTVYDGSTQSGIPVLDQSQHVFINLEGRLGRWLTPPDWDRFAVNGYAGAGYRYWNRSVAGEYNEQYSWKYLSLGFNPSLALIQGLSLGIELTIKQMLDGHMKLYLDDSTALDFDLGNKAGYKICVPLVYQPHPDWKIKWAPWYEYSAIGRSNSIYGYYDNGADTYYYEIYEPASQTVQYGVSMAVLFTLE